MPSYLITAPDGRKFKVTGEGSKEEALAHFQATYQPQEASAAEPAAPQRSGMQEFGRQLGLTGRYAVEGGLALPGLLAKIPAGIGNVGLSAADAVAERFGGNVDFRFKDPNQVISETLTQAGVPQPETRGEEVIGNMSRALAGAGGGMGLGKMMMGAQSPVASSVGQTMQSQPIVQGTSALTGSGSSEIAKEMGAGPRGQLVAGLGGSMIPGALSAAVPASVRAGFRGGEAGRQQVERNLQTFGKAGTTPTVGQATENRMMRGAESLLSRTPGGSGRIIAKAEQQAEELGAAIEKRAAQLVKKASGEQAGRTIERGIRGSGGFVERFRGQQEKLYSDLDNFIKPDKPVTVTNTQKALQELSTPIPGAEATSQSLINPRIAKLSQDLATDAAGGTVPYRAIKELRTLVGREMDEALIGDVPKAQWRRVYGALSDDMKEAANTSGPLAKAAWTRANKYTRAGMSRLESIESVVEKNGGPERIFQAATANTKEGATTLRAVMQSLDDGGRKTVSATVLRRLGVANPSNQNELGEKFSTSTFLTNWNKMSPEAKRTLFDRYGPKFRQDMDQIARITGNLREGSKVFQNPSGTEQAAAQAATVGGFVISLLTGQIQAAGTIAALSGGANLASRLMTNPRFVRWLAQSTKHPIGMAPSMVSTLAQQAAGDEDMALMAALLEKQIGDEEQGNEGRQ